MKAPTLKRLIATFRDLSRENAILIRRLAHAVDERSKLELLIEKHCPTTRAYVRSCYSDALGTHMWRTTVALHAIDVLLGMHGVEPLGPMTLQGPPFEYCNAGDPYVTTLIYHRGPDALRIGCWGDIVERHDPKKEW